MAGKMLSLEEMFYGQPEEVWVLKDEKKQGGGDKKEETKSEGTAAVTPLEKAFGKYYPYYCGPPYKAPEAPPKPKVPNPERKVELKVPICCQECVDTITPTIKEIKGVKTVTCDIGKEKVTVVALEAAKTDDIILACRSERTFRDSRLWTSDD